MNSCNLLLYRFRCIVVIVLILSVANIIALSFCRVHCPYCCRVFAASFVPPFRPVHARHQHPLTKRPRRPQCKHLSSSPPVSSGLICSGENLASFIPGKKNPEGKPTRDSESPCRLRMRKCQLRRSGVNPDNGSSLPLRYNRI